MHFSSSVKESVWDPNVYLPSLVGSSVQVQSEDNETRVLTANSALKQSVTNYVVGRVSYGGYHPWEAGCRCSGREFSQFEGPMFLCHGLGISICFLDFSTVSL